MRGEVLLSTDIGSDVDDALALLSIINSDINLSGIYTVNGDVVSRAYIAKEIVDLAGESIQVGIGEDKPIGGKVQPYTYFEETHVPDRFIDEEESDILLDTVYHAPKKVGVEPNGLEKMAEKLRQHPKSVFSIGPLTNIAKLLQNNPEVTNNITNLYVMGTRFTAGANEHNVRYDIPAARKVFESNLPITVMPGEVCSAYKVPINKIECLESKPGKYVKKMAKAFIAATTAENFRRGNMQSELRDNVNLNPVYFQNLHKEVTLNAYKRLKKDASTLADSFYASFYPEKYLRSYQKLITDLQDGSLNHPQGETFVELLQEGIPDFLSVADVYIPFIYLNLENIRTENATVSISNQGISTKKAVGRHSVVRDVDTNAFKKFYDTYVK